MDLSRRPNETEVFSYQRNYVAKVPDGDILSTLEHQAQTVSQFVRDIPASELEVVHSPYGWSVRTVIEHCCDAERVFGYRALRFATGEAVLYRTWVSAKESARF